MTNYVLVCQTEPSLSASTVKDNLNAQVYVTNVQHNNQLQSVNNLVPKFYGFDCVVEGLAVRKTTLNHRKNFLGDKEDLLAVLF